MSFQLAAISKLQMRIFRSIWTRAHLALAKNTQLSLSGPYHDMLKHMCEK